jgi:hypothetical protein
MTPPTIADIALREFCARRDSLRRAVDAGDWPGDPANENAQLWLAIALAAGAGPKLPPDVTDAISVTCIFPPGRRTLPPADDVADRDEMLAELARARDVAMDRAGPDAGSDRIQRAFDLDALAEALGAPPRDYGTKEGGAKAERDAA